MDSDLRAASATAGRATGRRENLARMLASASWGTSSVHRGYVLSSSSTRTERARGPATWFTSHRANPAVLEHTIGTDLDVCDVRGPPVASVADLVAAHEAPRRLMAETCRSPPLCARSASRARISGPTRPHEHTHRTALALLPDAVRQRALSIFSIVMLCLVTGNLAGRWLRSCAARPDRSASSGQASSVAPSACRQARQAAGHRTQSQARSSRLRCRLLRGCHRR